MRVLGVVSATAYLLAVGLHVAAWAGSDLALRLVFPLFGAAFLIVVIFVTIANAAERRHPSGIYDELLNPLEKMRGLLNRYGRAGLVLALATFIFVTAYALTARTRPVSQQPEGPPGARQLVEKGEVVRTLTEEEYRQMRLVDARIVSAFFSIFCLLPALYCLRRPSEPDVS